MLYTVVTVEVRLLDLIKPGALNPSIDFLFFILFYYRTVPFSQAKPEDSPAYVSRGWTD